MDTDERDLIRQAQAGDRGSFDALVDRYLDRVYSFALRLSGDRETAADATQDAFVKAWVKLRRFDLERGFRPWIFAIARNAVIDIARKRRDIGFSALSDDEGEFGDDLASEEELAPEEFDRAVESETLRAALERLSADQKAAVLMHDVEGMTFEEIADATKRPMNTEKSHYHRAIKKLRVLMKEAEESRTNGGQRDVHPS